MGKSDEVTPLMKQYWQLKTQVPDALLFFRMGDFYELFGDDAVEASTLLEITLTSRDRNKPDPTPMAGVPHHSAQGYIQRLLNSGKKVAIGEQMEDPEAIKGTAKIVRREIVRIFTPGIQFDSEGSEIQYLGFYSPSSPTRGTFACIDASTGQALISEEQDWANLREVIRSLPIRHLLLIEGSLTRKEVSLPESTLIEFLPKNYVSKERSTQILQNHYESQNLEPFFPGEEAITALGTLLIYILRTQKIEKLAHLRHPEPLQKPNCLVLGPHSVQHLDLPDLFKLINETRSTLGARELKRWLLAPLIGIDQISLRQQANSELSKLPRSAQEKISQELSQIYDLERIAGRINTGLASPRDTYALGVSLSRIESVAELASNFSSELLKSLKSAFQKVGASLKNLSERIIRTQNPEAPLNTREGRIFKKGTHPDLDHLISLTTDGQQWLINLENKERESSGISSLKVRYNRVFGYYIEVTQAHLKSVPSHYQRKQTMVGAERFFTEELKKFEDEILTASFKQKSLEQELFADLLREIQHHTSFIMKAARLFGELDALISLSKLSNRPGWCLPVIDDSLELQIQASRHPLVDQAKGGRFIPNDILLNSETSRLLLITGPNMGGKSTVMRQIALSLILGQMGAPIPGKSAHWGAVSSIYTRIGAHDAIAKGQSTFMVEMSELAHILHRADQRSFIILDEIGRGTSTYDGMSVAWATLEWISRHVQARTLFATHYHELIHLAQTLPRLSNAHMAVEVSDNTHGESFLHFLYELRPGPTNDSLGIYVAKLAGMPKEVIERAWSVLKKLEETESSRKQGKANEKANPAAFERNQLALFEVQKPRHITQEVHPIIRELDQLNVNDLTPLQALNFLAKIKNLRADHKGSGNNHPRVAETSGSLFHN